MQSNSGSSITVINKRIILILHHRNLEYQNVYFILLNIFLQLTLYTKKSKGRK